MRQQKSQAKDSRSDPMRRTIRLSQSLALLAAIISVANAGRLSGAFAAPAKPPVSLEIFPSEATLTGDEPSQHFVVLAKYGDNIERDVTPNVDFILSAPDKGQ